ncbi:MAG: HD-GYP domain-containing protein [Anaerolineales bacterium]|nr:HD-GYP domain-containing protein [Anaerolineales bacterium]
MQSDFALKKLPNPQQRLDALFQAFDGLMLVLDDSGRILDYKAGNGSQLDISVYRKTSGKFQDIVPAEVGRKYKNALQELRNGSKVVLFEYMLEVPMEKVWYESRLVPFTNGQNIMFVRNITKYKQSSSDELTLAYDKTIESWSQALYLRDQETEDHTRRVTDMALKLARRLNISNGDLIHIKRGSILHDIGKMAIPDNILFKPGPLTEEEWVVMRRHPVIAAEILKPIPYLAPALPIPLSHHEKWDGSGYPHGLAGKAIPLFARIFAFADVYDALISDRPYRRAWSQAQACAYIAEQSGLHFDPSITPVFIGMVSEA